ncbi:MAG TPA: glycoside hydrolase family 44 protein [Planctomycetota bacterium]|nr:glycoside hydrolase family 44 protein [Planctomycetota bacterium]
MRTPFLIAVLAVVLGCPASEIVVTIDDAAPRHVVPEAYHGSNFVALWNDTGASPGTRAATARLGIDLLRFPGGVPCQWYDWQKPLETGWTVITPEIAWSLADAAGASMIFQTNCAGNEFEASAGKARFDSSGAHMAAWVAAAKAAGVRVAWWEIGNEPELDAPAAYKASLDAIYAWYNAVYAEQARAIKAADPQARVLGPAATNTWFWWHEKTLEKFLAAHGDKAGTGLADGISLHWYPEGGEGTWAEKRGTAQGWAACHDYIRAVIDAHSSTPLPLYVTEWNWGGGDKNASMTTLGCGLGNADVVGMFLRTGVAGHAHFCLQRVDHGWGVLAMQGEALAENSASPSYFALSIAARMGSRVFATAHGADEANVMSAYATGDAAGGRQVMLINKSEGALDIDIAFSRFAASGRTARIFTLVGANGSPEDVDVVYNGARGVTPAQADLPGPEIATIAQSLRRRLPPYSLTLIDIAGDAAKDR